jgi:outer membrane receptor protein involved in Fe transport
MFVQDQLRLGSWTINVGLRWDHYRLMVNEHSVSPRLGVAWWWPRGDLVVRAFYDRAFQTPAIENLLLASSPAVDNLDPAVVRLPVPPSRGHFVEAGSRSGSSLSRASTSRNSRGISPTLPTMTCC